MLIMLGEDLQHLILWCSSLQTLLPMLCNIMVVWASKLSIFVVLYDGVADTSINEIVAIQLVKLRHHGSEKRFLYGIFHLALAQFLLFQAVYISVNLVLVRIFPLAVFLLFRLQI